MWVLIDNYDSFTHILHHYLLQAGGECQTARALYALIKKRYGTA